MDYEISKHEMIKDIEKIIMPEKDLSSIMN